MSSAWNFNNSYLDLPKIFYVQQAPTPVKQAKMVLFNTRLAEQLGLQSLAEQLADTTQTLAGNILPEGACPIAQAYAGHQFGHFTMLGDGRAILLGEHITPAQMRVDIQLKGAGLTAFSRSGDGRAALAPMLRELIISEAMAALDIPTTRGLAVVATGEAVYRTEPLKGAILTRIASSHIRVGTFEYALMRNQKEDLQALADYTIQRHYPEAAQQENPYLALLISVMHKQADLIARWMSVGFIHGVMNTDNMSIAGETIDYGPCAFMNRYDPDTVFSSIDTRGRYAYAQQPKIAQWNLLRFAETLLPLLDDDQQQAIAMAVEPLEKFPEIYEAAWLTRFAHKLGIQQPVAEDLSLIHQLLDMMYVTQADFTNSFRALADNSIHQQAVFQHKEFEPWFARWEQRLRQQSITQAQSQQMMLQMNPAVIPRNHLVEEALAAAQDHDDMHAFEALLEVVRAPFTAPSNPNYSQPPSSEAGYRTFCGT